MAAIFISHSSKDAEQASRIKTWLAEDGYERVFLDFDKHSGLGAGEMWERRLYVELQRSHAVILLLTSNWFDSKWCFAEFTQARALGKVIFPVILKPMGETRVLAPEIQSIDLRDWNPEGEAHLRERIGEVISELAHRFKWDQSRSPYPGIFAFDEQDAAIFFGRDEPTRDVLEKLQSHRVQGGTRFILILGNSGSGKSSLLKAGVIPQLKRDPRIWITLPVIRAEYDPLINLAKSIASASGNDGMWTTWLETLSKTGAKESLRKIADALRIGKAIDATIILPVDQFEEVFTVTEPEKRAFFLNFLAVATNSAHSMPFIVLATARSDVFNDILKGETSIRVDDYPLQPMPFDLLPKVIDGPAEIAALSLENGLTQRIVSDVKSIDALPLLAFALREMYEKYGNTRRLTIQNYESLGNLRANLTPIQNVVRRKAESALKKASPSAIELTTLRGLFIPNLVRIRDDGALVRQPMPLAEIPPEAVPLVNALVDARLLTKRVSVRATEFVLEVSHETLFSAWPLLKTWLTEEREFLVGKAQLLVALETWKSAPPNLKNEALLQGLALRRATVWYETRRKGLKAPEIRFIEDSLAAKTRSLYRRAALASVVVTLVLALFVPSIYSAYVQRTALQCDLYAAEPINNVHVPGVEFDKIIPERAIPECTSAVNSQPDNPRLIGNLARSLDRAGQYQEAVRWYTKAADLGWMPSTNALGVMLLTGRGTALNISRGISLIQKAAEADDLDGLANYTRADISGFLKNNAPAAKIVQISLNEKGFLSHTEITGVWTSATEAALTAFKSSLSLTDPGITPRVLVKLGIVNAISDTTGTGVSSSIQR